MPRASSQSSAGPTVWKEPKTTIRSRGTRSGQRRRAGGSDVVEPSASGAAICGAMRAASAALPCRAHHRSRPTTTHRCNRAIAPRFRPHLCRPVFRTPRAFCPRVGSARRLRASTRAASGLCATSNIQVGSTGLRRRDHLEAPDQTHGRQAARTPPRAGTGRRRRELLEGRDGGRRIGELGVARERRRRQIRQVPARAAVVPRLGVARKTYSTPRRLSGAPTALRDGSSTAGMSRLPSTAGMPRRKIPAFSRAMASSVDPRNS